MVMIGASLLWVGWFGFNAGSAVAADGRATVAFAAGTDRRDLMRSVLGEEHPNTLATRSFRAYLYGRQGRKDDAEQIFLQVIQRLIFRHYISIV